CFSHSRETDLTAGWQRDFLSQSPRRQPWRSYLFAELPSFSAVHAWLSVRRIFVPTREKPGEIIVFWWFQCQMGQSQRLRERQGRFQGSPLAGVQRPQASR